MVHAAGGLLVLLTATTLAVYKPAGLTWYGKRKQRKQGSANAESGLVSSTSTPRWVKVFGIIVIVMILNVGVMIVIGGHGPGAHTPSGG
jgi:hypothetical protein